MVREPPRVRVESLVRVLVDDECESTDRVATLIETRSETIRVGGILLRLDAEDRL